MSHRVTSKGLAHPVRVDLCLLSGYPPLQSGMLFHKVGSGVEFHFTADQRRLASSNPFGRLSRSFQFTAARRRLHQPQPSAAVSKPSFNSQPPEGGCAGVIEIEITVTVSIHSRPKAAAGQTAGIHHAHGVSIHSRPKAAAELGFLASIEAMFSINSRPKAAARLMV